eukprot:scaffold16560_cov99-Isochrysis_galbana.AAC.3
MDVRRLAVPRGISGRVSSREHAPRGHVGASVHVERVRDAPRPAVADRAAPGRGLAPSGGRGRGKVAAGADKDLMGQGGGEDDQPAWRWQDCRSRGEGCRRVPPVQGSLHPAVVNGSVRLASMHSSP